MESPPIAMTITRMIQDTAIPLSLGRKGACAPDDNIEGELPFFSPCVSGGASVTTMVYIRH